MRWAEMAPEPLEAEHKSVSGAFAKLQAKGVTPDMFRGKPGSEN